MIKMQVQKQIITQIENHDGNTHHRNMMWMCTSKMSKYRRE
jgi:hypothetical protein